MAWINDFEAEFGKWFDTPDEFLSAIGYFAAGAALANRVFLRSPDEISTNLYVLICSPPGWYRKSSPMRVAVRMMKAVVPPAEVLPSNPSVEALGKIIPGLCQNGRGQGIFVFDEFRSFLMHIRKEYAAPVGSLVTEKLERGIPVTFARKKEGGVEIDVIPEDFILSFIASTTTPWLLESLRGSDISGGMMSRFLVVEAHEKTRDFQGLPPPIDGPAVANLAAELIRIRNSHTRTEFFFRQDASRLYAGIYREVETKAMKHGHPEYPSLVSRAPMYVKKLALLHAVLSERGDTAITAEDVETAAGLVYRSVRSCDAIVDEAVAGDGAYGKNLIRVKKILSSKVRTSKRDLLRAMHIRTRDLDEILESLKEQGHVNVEKDGRQSVLVWQEDKA